MTAAGLLQRLCLACGKTFALLRLTSICPTCMRRPTAPRQNAQDGAGAAGTAPDSGQAVEAAHGAAKPTSNPRGIPA